VPIVLKSGSLNLLEPSGPVQACNGIALPLHVPCVFFILYCDQQMHNYFTNYHTPTCFDTIVSFSGSF